MHRIFTLIIVSFFFCHLYSQRLAPDKYWIPLADKNNSEYTLNNPAEYLSHAAISRRNRQMIPISKQDLPVVKSYLDSLQSTGLKILGTSKWFNAAIVQADSIDLIYKALEFSFILPFNPESAYRINNGVQSTLDTVQSEFDDSGLNYPENDYGLSLKQLDILGGRGLHELGYKGSGVKIAVMDAGFYKVNSLQAFSHLWDDNRILGYRDFVDMGSDIFTQSSHGMSVLSTMAAYIPGLIIGTAPEASYWLLRTEDARSEYKIEEANWVMAAEFADSAGADIITTSLGYNQFDDASMDYTFEDMNGQNSLSSKAADIAFEKGIVVIISAGNEGNKTWGKITAPSDAFNVLAVGAIDTALNLASFSSRGPAYDGRIKPDVLAVGAQTVILNSSGTVSNGSGTSYAAPQIAGLTACLWQALPQKSNLEIIKSIKVSSDGFHNPNENRGYGIPDFLLAFYKLSAHEYSDNRVKIVPNPFSHSMGEFQISFDIEVKTIEIIDVTGLLLLAFPVDLKPNESTFINPQGISQGVYLISGRNNKQVRVSRLIIQ